MQAELGKRAQHGPQAGVACSASANRRGQVPAGGTRLPRPLSITAASSLPALAMIYDVTSPVFRSFLMNKDSKPQAQQSFGKKV